MNLESLQQEIVRRLQSLDPKEIIIFGSYARGETTSESDVDLYVVTKDQYIPQNYQEKRELVRKVSRQLLDLRQTLSIDLLVHTEAMNKRFYALDSSFAREIQEKGLSLL